MAIHELSTLHVVYWQYLQRESFFFLLLFSVLLPHSGSIRHKMLHNVPSAHGEQSWSSQLSFTSIAFMKMEKIHKSFFEKLIIYIYIYILTIQAT